MKEKYVLVIAQVRASMLSIHKKITLTVLDFINASIQWQDYHRWLEFWSLFVREENNSIDDKWWEICGKYISVNIS